LARKVPKSKHFRGDERRLVGPEVPTAIILDLPDISKPWAKKMDWPNSKFIVTLHEIRYSAMVTT